MTAHSTYLDDLTQGFQADVKHSRRQRYWHQKPYKVVPQWPVVSTHPLFGINKTHWWGLEKVEAKQGQHKYLATGYKTYPTGQVLWTMSKMRGSVHVCIRISWLLICNWICCTKNKVWFGNSVCGDSPLIAHSHMMESITSNRNNLLMNMPEQTSPTLFVAESKWTSKLHPTLAFPFKFRAASYWTSHCSVQVLYIVQAKQ